MEANVLISKIVANPTDTTWAQAYSTLNLYIVLSLKHESVEKNIVTSGKELLERIQREYFSESEKSLENIKKSIEVATSDIEDKNTVSLALSTISADTLYLVTVGAAKVILKRGEKVGIVAKGEAGEINAFVGKIQANDIIMLETEGFAEKLPVSKLSSLLDNLEVTEISENLAPIIHKEPLGSEAAIILQYKKFDRNAGTIEDDQKKEIEKESQKEAASNDVPVKDGLLSGINIPKVNIPENLLALGKTKLVIISIILLAVVLFASIIFERGRQEKAKREAILSEMLTPAQEKYEEANALVALNRGLALDEFSEIKDTLTSSADKLKTGTDERKELDEFIGKVEGKIGELGTGSTLANQKMIYENVIFVTFRDGQLAAINKNGKIFLLDSNGKLKKEIDSKNNNAEALSADETAVFTYGGAGITRSTKTGTTKTIVDDAKQTAALDTFGTNLYGLNIGDKTVDKYAGASYAKSEYFTEDVTLKVPSSMSIDGSIWILDGGKIRRFTKGKEVSFTLSGVTKEISPDSQIFTGIDYANIYVLDTGSNRIISISKDGEVKNQYVSKELTNATSFAVDESGKKIYVVISGKLYSFDL